MAGAFGVWHEVAFHAGALLLVDVDPAFWEESMRVWEYVSVGLVEYRCHADDSLRLLEPDWVFKRVDELGVEVYGSNDWNMSGTETTYSGWDLPMLVVERLIARKSLMSSNFTGTKSTHWSVG